MPFESIRTWDGENMQELLYSWDREEPMHSPDTSDINQDMIYENDILQYKKYIAIIRRGPFHYNGKLLNGWYLECYFKDNKSISPFIQNEEYEIIGNIYKDKDLYIKLKLREGVRISDFIG